MKKIKPTVIQVFDAPAPLEKEKLEALYSFLFESLTEYAVFAVSPVGTVISWNAGAQNTFGYTSKDIVGKYFGLIFTPEDVRIGAPASELEAALNGGKTDHDRWHVRKDGTRFWGTNTVQPMFDQTGVLLGFAKLVRDYTDRHLADEALNASEERLRILIESVREYAIFSIDLDGAIASWNAGAEAVFGYSAPEVIGRSFSTLYTADDQRAEIPARELREATLHGDYTDERWLVRKDGTRFLSSGKLSQLKRGQDGRFSGFVTVAHDITELRRAADEMRHRALNDQLTKLPNRAAFYEHVHRAIAAMKRRSTSLFAVLFIDLDRFKAVNDRYGHIIADKLLEAAARRLEQCVRAGDIVARLGGDEFAILLNGINGVKDATNAGDRIGVAMAVPVPIEGHTVPVTASVGIALGGATYDKPQDILRDADAAMYAAKTRGRARAVLFDPSMRTSLSQNRDLEDDLGQALVRDELRVEYQPIVALSSRAIVGFEALVRWAHPGRGLLQPHEFVPTAEETDAIIAIDRWVFRIACEQLKAWQLERDVALAPLSMSMNFSSRQFSHADVVEYVRTTIDETGVDPHRVRIEITESVILENSYRTSALLEQIRALGVELRVDDFGTGYSSLSALQHLPVDALKIDRSFIAGMGLGRGSNLVHSIVLFAHNLELMAIAEGVETAEQLEALERFGCEFAQGFFFSRPLDPIAAGNILRGATHNRITA